MDIETARHNQLLARLPSHVLETLLRSAHVIGYRRRESFTSSGEPIHTLRFPLSGMASMVGVDERGQAVEVATIGVEGVVGVQALFRERPSPFEMMWQLPGRAVVTSTADARAAMETHPALAAALADYLASLFVQAAQNGACNRLHDIEQRAAKWLLLCADRVPDGRLDLAQEFFAVMLGVSRPKLAIVERTLRQAGYIDERTNGGIEVLDRAGLEEVACGCYAIIAHECAALNAEPEAGAESQAV
jgi:CRP-like cAMP-binding protein